VNFRVTVFLFLLFFVGIGTVFSQETVLVTILPSEPVAVAKGQTAQLTITAKIKKGFHIQANPAADEFLIPTTLTVQASEGIVPGKTVYPPGQPYRLKDSMEDLLTYEDEVTIMLPIKVMDSAPAGNTKLTGKLNFQPCDDRKCLFPRSVPIIIPVKIVHSQL
jgi:DsbC/DsbD-like thiol-disulfide interchange protein